MKVAKKLVAVAAIAVMAVATVSCQSAPKFGPAQCSALAGLAIAVAVQITNVVDEEKTALVAEYGNIVGNLAAFGCSFVPEPVEDLV